MWIPEFDVFSLPHFHCGLLNVSHCLDLLLKLSDHRARFSSSRDPGAASAVMKPVEVGRCGSAESFAVVKKMMGAPDMNEEEEDMNSPVLKDFVIDACGNAQLLTWAQQICSIGKSVQAQACLYEGHSAKPGEAFG